MITTLLVFVAFSLLCSYVSLVFASFYYAGFSGFWQYD